ncbi:hypothetical protein KUCAC02_028899 [Chaenocephalus aceratus]|uniref:Uncharacterized protein n=1 Tax=Chaenocephalus aceratus TaxID=36190 RepID=A0ACB9X3Z9_CHAAC|nr:hypothetical protein KUCAC02_028899 [Chaenocephalus aceratus]
MKWRCVRGVSDIQPQPQHHHRRALSRGQRRAWGRGAPGNREERREPGHRHRRVEYVGGEATPDADFTGTGGILVFDGDVNKTIQVLIRDDIEPEDNESLMIGLVNTEGGSRILPSSDTVTIVILANDNVAGIVDFIQPHVLSLPEKVRGSPYRC